MQTRDPIENQNKVSTYSSTRHKRIIEEVDGPDQTTRCDLDRVMEERQKMKRVRKDQSADQEIDNNPLSLDI